MKRSNKKKYSAGRKNNISAQKQSIQSKEELKSLSGKDLAALTLIIILLIVNISAIVKINRVSSDMKELEKTSIEDSKTVSATVSDITSDKDKADEVQNSTDKEQEETQEQTQEQTQEAEEETSKPGEGKKVFLTFDDGPTNNTRIILDILDKYDVKATFFVVVTKDDSCTDVYKEILDRGHTLAVHSYSHDYNVVYSDMDSFINDVTSIQNYVENLTGYRPDIYRFPGGSSSTLGNLDRKDCIRYLKSNGISYFDWNVSSGDASSKYVSPEQIIANVYNDLGKYDDSVVLMHDTSFKTSTVVALDTLIQRMLDDGYTLERITKDIKRVQHISENSVE